MEENKNTKGRRRVQRWGRQLTPKSFRQFSNHIWTIRKKRRLGQKQTAFLMGMKDTAYLSRYESGKKMPGLINAMLLAKALSTSISALFPELDAQLDRIVLARREKLPLESQIRNLKTFL